jgi:hypothetical protein
MSDEKDSITAVRRCACGQETHRGRRCRECFNNAHREQQNARREQAPKKRCGCGVDIPLASKRCRACNMALVGAATAEREKTPVVARKAAEAWPGLRGRGGEWEHGPTSVQGWATLDGGRA